MEIKDNNMIVEEKVVLFTITCRTSGGYTGKGGHYYSLITIADELIKSGVNCSILVIGSSNTEVIIKSGIPYTYIFFDKFNLKKTRLKISNLINSLNVNIVHSFDSYSYFVCSRTYGTLALKRVLTKCGGKSPGKNFPKPSSLTLFSNENLFDVKKSRKFKNTKAYLIPNRVRSFKLNKDRSWQLKKNYKINNTDFIVMRIARIGKDYESSIYQTLALSRLIREITTLNVKTIIIGKVQDDIIYNNIVKKKDVNDIVLTSEEYTYNAKEYLNLASIVVATGRGVMEASSLGKFIYVPIDQQNGDYPVLLNESTFDNLFFYNFSPRNTVKTSEEDTIKDYKSIDFTKPSNFTREVFENYFDVRKVPEKYLHVYNEADTSMDRLHHLYVDFKFILKKCIKNIYDCFSEKG